MQRIHQWSLAAMILALLLGSACVTKSTHLALQASCDQSAEEAAKRDTLHQAAIKDLEAALTEERGRHDVLETQQRAQEEAMAQLSGKNKEMMSALAEAQERKKQADARIAEFRELVRRFQSLINSGKLTIRIENGLMIVEMATDILFRSASATLSRKGRSAIKEVTAVLKDIPDRRFQIGGHTDNIPMSGGAFDNNWELAFGRAMSVVETMVAAGMPPTRVSATSFGEFRPAATNRKEDGRAKNRRIEIIVVPDLSMLPGVDALEKKADDLNAEPAPKPAPAPES